MLFAMCSLWTQSSNAATCDAEDYETHVSGASQCLVMRRFGDLEPQTLLVWLHGDVSAGGPADYLYAGAEAAARALSAGKVLSVAILRPGYPDAGGNTSSVATLQSGRSDHYTRENITEVGTAIERLRARYKPGKVIVIGHSGGAATTAVLLGLKPQLINSAVLVACPCDVVAWRSGRRAWSRSESPIKWADKVDTSTRVMAMTGQNDDNTSPDLARAYVQALQARGINAAFKILPNETHNSASRSPEVLNAVRELVESK